MFKTSTLRSIALLIPLHMSSIEICPLLPSCIEIILGLALPLMLIYWPNIPEKKFLLSRPI